MTFIISRTAGAGDWERCVLLPLVGRAALDIQQSSLNNRLLKAFPAEDFAFVRMELRPVTTVLHQSLIEPGVPIRELFFPEAGFVSVTTAGKERIEVGLIGREGLAGAIPVLLGVDRSPYKHFVQASGHVLAIEAIVLSNAMRRSPALHGLMMRFIHTLYVQTAHTAFVNAALNIETRLARWLVMCQDRLDGDELALTHEFLAMMLGVQRTSVTMSLQVLEGNGLIRSRRGKVQIRNRKDLEGLASAGYGVPEAEYTRVIDGVS